jgi:hypothetical protein
MFYPHLIASMQLGGMNSFLLTESQHSIPLVSNVPTLIIGMDVSHGSPGQSDVPSIAAVWHNLVEPCTVNCDINHNFTRFNLLTFLVIYYTLTHDLLFRL